MSNKLIAGRPRPTRNPAEHVTDIEQAVFREKRGPFGLGYSRPGRTGEPTDVGAWWRSGALLSANF